MEWADYFAVVDPTSGEKLEGEFRAVLDGVAAPEVQSEIKREVNFSLCEVLNFSGEPVRQMCADLDELTHAVQNEAEVALVRLGAKSPVAIANVRFAEKGEDLLAGWSPSHPQFHSTFASTCRKTGLELSGTVRGRFVGTAPDDPSFLGDAIGDALSRLLAVTERGVVDYFADMHRVNDALNEEIAPMLELMNARGYAVIESGAYDDASDRAIGEHRRGGDEARADEPGAQEPRADEPGGTDA